jgi:hemoglobin
MRAASIFEELGGFARVHLIVSDFYEKILDSERLSRFFQDVDVANLIDHQTKFIAAMMGGPASYTDEHIGRAHLRLGITSDDFDEMAVLFRETLEDTGVAEPLIKRLCAHLTGMREHVVAGERVMDEDAAATSGAGRVRA